MTPYTKFICFDFYWQYIIILIELSQTFKKIKIMAEKGVKKLQMKSGQTFTGFRAIIKKIVFKVFWPSGSRNSTF